MGNREIIMFPVATRLWTLSCHVTVPHKAKMRTDVIFLWYEGILTIQSSPALCLLLSFNQVQLVFSIRGTFCCFQGSKERCTFLLVSFWRGGRRGGWYCFEDTDDIVEGPLQIQHECNTQNYFHTNLLSLPKKQALSSALLVTSVKHKQTAPEHLRELMFPCVIFKILFSTDHVTWAFVTFQWKEGNSASCIPLTSHHNCQTCDWPIRIFYKVETFGYFSFHLQWLKSYSPFNAELG